MTASICRLLGLLTLEQVMADEKFSFPFPLQNLWQIHTVFGWDRMCNRHINSPLFGQQTFNVQQTNCWQFGLPTGRSIQFWRHCHLFAAKMLLTTLNNKSIYTRRTYGKCSSTLLRKAQLNVLELNFERRSKTKLRLIETKNRREREKKTTNILKCKLWST